MVIPATSIFFNNGGAARWDTQITILQTDGTTQIAYNDDFFSLQSDVSFTATFTGTVYVLVSQFSCNNTGDSTGATFGGASVYWGVTSARGGLNNQQYFCPTTVIILPAEMGHFSTVCDGTSEYFEWTAITENRVDYFTLEYTYDGLVFHPLESVSSAGQSLGEVEYMLKIESQDPKQRYYRLKIVDDDGTYEYTDLIAGKACGTSQNQLISSISQQEDNLKISLY
ncbi:MAG: hypothetical protein P8H56_10920 [Crocinitomicaceae bacterium]|nr:hypothetical protein [Crocinitomicaceae bacterium]MDG1659084.1 hypothetical protein [Crocinitomicaceae bacterium]